MKSHPFELLKAFHIALAIGEFIEEVFTPVFTALFSASVLCTALIVLKVSLSGTVAFVFLIWNLFLAWVPFLISKAISFKSRYDNEFSWKLSLLWLVFFPNAPYLLTDFIHLNTYSPLFWLDVVILFSCALTGLALGIASLLKMHYILLKEFGKNISRAIITTILPLTAFGVFLGRELRWNSWDILTNPATLLKDITGLFHGKYTVEMLQFTFVFTIFFAAIYCLARKIQLRIKNTHSLHHIFKNN